MLTIFLSVSKHHFDLNYFFCHKISAYRTYKAKIKINIRDRMSRIKPVKTMKQIKNSNQYTKCKVLVTKKCVWLLIIQPNLGFAQYPTDKS